MAGMKNNFGLQGNYENFMFILKTFALEICSSLAFQV